MPAEPKGPLGTHSREARTLFSLQDERFLAECPPTSLPVLHPKEFLLALKPVIAGLIDPVCAPGTSDDDQISASLPGVIDGVLL